MRPLQNSLRQLFKIKLDKRHMTESLVGTGTSFHEAVNATIVVEPVKAPFNFPALPRVSGFP